MDIILTLKILWAVLFAALIIIIGLIIFIIKYKDDKGRPVATIDDNGIKLDVYCKTSNAKKLYDIYGDVNEKTILHSIGDGLYLLSLEIGDTIRKEKPDITIELNPDDVAEKVIDKIEEPKEPFDIREKEPFDIREYIKTFRVTPIERDYGCFQYCRDSETTLAISYRIVIDSKSFIKYKDTFLQPGKDIPLAYCTVIDNKERNIVGYFSEPESSYDKNHLEFYFIAYDALKYEDIYGE